MLARVLRVVDYVRVRVRTPTLLGFALLYAHSGRLLAACSSPKLRQWCVEMRAIILSAEMSLFLRIPRRSA